MNKDILVISDESKENTFALEKAAQIAKSFSSNLFIAGFVSSIAQLDEKLKHLKEQVSSLHEEQLKVDVDVDVFQTENIVETVKEILQQKQYDLVVKTGHRTESIYYTPLDWQLIRNLDCPLLILTDQKWRSKSYILATLDLSASDTAHQQLNSKVIEYANNWSSVTNQDLQSCYVLAVNNAMKELDIVDKQPITEEVVREAKSAYSRLSNDIQLSENSLHIVSGVPYKEIPSYANNIKANLVVVGSIGRKGLKGLLLGNTAEKILHHLHTDILILRPKE